jgi:ketosteroid isomerase-like protein
MPLSTPRPAASPEARLREFWALFDAKDYQALLRMMTDDAIETDDFAKVWLRGHAAIGQNFARIGERYEDSHTAIEDVNVTATSSTAVVSCVVRYQMRWDGQPFSVNAPTTMVFVRESGAWRVALLHTR